MNIVFNPFTANFDYVGAAGAASTFVNNEVVSGTGTSFTLASTPLLGTEHLTAGRNRLYPTTDYTISGTAITTVLTWATGDLLADYQTA